MMIVIAKMLLACAAIRALIDAIEYTFLKELKEWYYHAVFALLFAVCCILVAAFL